MELLTPELGLFVWTLLAFLIVFFILRATAWKPILKGLGERERGIADSIAQADKVRAQMAQLQSENEAALRTAREERTAMLREAKEAGDAMIAKAKVEAKATADKMIEDAREQIHNNKMAAITDVRNEIGQLSVTIAERILREKLQNDGAQNNFAHNLAKELTLN